MSLVNKNKLRCCICNWFQVAFWTTAAISKVFPFYLRIATVASRAAILAPQIDLSQADFWAHLYNDFELSGHSLKDVQRARCSPKSYRLWSEQPETRLRVELRECLSQEKTIGYILSEFILHSIFRIRNYDEELHFSSKIILLRSNNRIINLPYLQYKPCLFPEVKTRFFLKKTKQK
mgnify:CR=1 FL=1